MPTSRLAGVGPWLIRSHRRAVAYGVETQLQKLFDTELMLTRRLRALHAPTGPADFLMAHVADDLGERLQTVERRFTSGATLFSFTDHARAAMSATGRASEIVRVEADAAFLGGDTGLIGSLEHVPLQPASVDLAVSLLSLHEANDLPGALIQIRRSLTPDGLFLGALPGAGTLAELRESLLVAETEITGGASPRVMPFADVRDAGALLQRAGFALPVADVETLTVRYDTLFDLIRDLRAMGATNALADRSRRPGTRRLFRRAAEIYAERFAAPDGRVRATFSIIWLSGWAPDPSQQKPLRPGSGKMSLRSALEEK